MWARRWPCPSYPQGDWRHRLPPFRGEDFKHLAIDHEGLTVGGFLGVGCDAEGVAASVGLGQREAHLGLLPLTLAYERIGGRGFGGALVVLTAMDTACIVRCGSEEMKKRLLPKQSLKMAENG